MIRTKLSAFFWFPYQSNPSLKEQKPYVQSWLLVLSKVTVMMYGFFFSRHCGNGSSKIKGNDYDKYYIPVSYAD